MLHSIDEGKGALTLALYLFGFPSNIKLGNSFSTFSTSDPSKFLDNSKNCNFPILKQLPFCQSSFSRKAGHCGVPAAGAVQYQPVLQREAQPTCMLRSRLSSNAFITPTDRRGVQEKAQKRRLELPMIFKCLRLMGSGHLISSHSLEQN